MGVRNDRILKQDAANSPGQLAATWFKARSHAEAAYTALTDLERNVRQGRQERSDAPPCLPTTMPRQERASSTSTN